MKLKALVMMVVTLALGATLIGQDQMRERKLQQAIDLLETKGDAVRAMPLLEDVAKARIRPWQLAGSCISGRRRRGRAKPARGRRTNE